MPYKYNTPEVISYLENNGAKSTINKDGYYPEEYASKERRMNI